MQEPAQSSYRSVLSSVNRHGAEFFHQLFDRGFNWIVASEAVVDIGVLARVAAQSWVAYDLTQSSLWVGAIAAFRAIPSFLSPAIAAYIGNHVNHRLLVATMRAFIGILAIVQAILIGTGMMRPWHQAVLTLFTGLAIAFAWPSFVTFLNDIVQPRMATRANAVLTFSHNLGELAGPIAVGVIIALIGAALILNVPPRFTRRKLPSPLHLDPQNRPPQHWPSPTTPMAHRHAHHHQPIRFIRVSAHP